MPEGRENKRKGPKNVCGDAYPSIGGGVAGHIYHVPLTYGFTEWEGARRKSLLRKSDDTAPDFDMCTTIGINRCA
jgi:hypothetical protein